MAASAPAVDKGGKGQGGCQLTARQLAIVRSMTSSFLMLARSGVYGGGFVDEVRALDAALDKVGTTNSKGKCGVEQVSD